MMDSPIGFVAGLVAFIGCSFLSAYCLYLYWRSGSPRR